MKHTARMRSFLYQRKSEYENVTIALSGDTGFYSGAKKILELDER